MPNQFHERIPRNSGAVTAEDRVPLIEALECRIGRAHFAVPTEAIERIVEYRAWPLPLGKGWVGGLSLHEGVPVVSVDVQRAKDKDRSGTPIKGILLRAPTSPIGWALEIDEVFFLVQVRPVDRRDPDGKLPPWIQIATTLDRRSLGLVDVAGMLADLADIDGAAGGMR